MSDLFFETILLRTPAFPLQTYDELVTKKTEDAIADLLSNNFFLNALYLASKDVYNLALSYSELKDDKKEKFQKTILKYAIRSSTRCTPFGLFAANQTFKTYGAQSSIILKSNKRYAHLRLDMNYSLKLANTLINHPSIKYHLKYFTNDTIYKFDRKYRYLEYNFYNSNFKKYTLSSIDANALINHILQKAKNGITFSNLIQEISDKTDATYSESFEFAQEILDSQIILSELEVSSIGLEPASQIAATINKISADSEDPSSIKEIVLLNKQVNKIFDEVKNCQASIFDKTFIKNSVKLKEEISNITDFESKSLIQCDLYNTDASGGLSVNQLKLIKKSLLYFKKFKHIDRKKDSRLEKFKLEFIKRYEQKLIPICEALDPDIGIKYGRDVDVPPIEGNPLINGIPFDSKDSERTISLDKMDYLILNKIQNSKNEIITIKESELGEVVNNKFINRLPSESVMFSLFKHKKNEEDFVIINSLIEGSANRILGRFTSGNNEINDLSRDIVNYEEEQSGNTIYAEIDHFPESHLGNVIFRNTTYSHIIGFLGGNKIKKVLLSDVFVRVEHSMIILWSKSLNEEIIPMYSNVLNSSLETHLPLFQLLLDVSAQYKEIYNPIDWNKYHQFYQFIPRIQIENLILKKGSWILKLSEFNVKDLVSVRNLLTEKKINRFFVLIQGDNEIVIDKDNNLMLEIFLDELKKLKSLIAHEYIFDDFKSVVYDENQNQYNNEFILSVKKNVFDYSNYQKRGYYSTNNQSLFIDDGWLFLKLYVSENIADKFLTAILSPLLKLEKEKKIHMFFFIKYYDPKFHIRLRVKTDEKNIYEIINLLTKKVRKNDFISDFSINKYDREMERYGHEQIPFFEKIFHFDSILCIKAFPVFKENIWKYGLMITDHYCNFFGLSVKDKIVLLESIKMSFEKELNANSMTTKFINKKYSENRFEIENLLQYGHVFMDDNKKILAAINSEVNKIGYHSTEQRDFFLRSIIHMSIVRLAKSYNRINEFAIISILTKGSKAKLYHNKNIHND